MKAVLFRAFRHTASTDNGRHALRLTQAPSDRVAQWRQAARQGNTGFSQTSSKGGMMRNFQSHAPQALQLPLPLPLDRREESVLRTAHRSAGLNMPFEAAMSVPALAICLRCLGEARQKLQSSTGRTRGFSESTQRMPKPRRASASRWSVQVELPTAAW